MHVIESVRNFGRHVWLMLRNDPAAYYTILGREYVETVCQNGRPDRPLWINNGYWKEAKTLPQACAALAQLLGEAAQLNASDRMLDVGFGYADQDFYWLERFRVFHITGINVTPLHVEVAKKRVVDQGMEHKLDLQLGSATALPFDDQRFDKVVALECAHHFRTRELFFKEAFRVLRSGGRLALADMLPYPGERWSGMGRYLHRRLCCIPEENLYDRFAYAEKMQSAGFRNITMVSIREYVYPGLAKCMRLLRATKADRFDHIVVELNDEEIRNCSGSELWYTLGEPDYVIVTGERP